MEEIKVGEYVRTKDGEIGIYLGIDAKYEMYDYDVNGNRSSCKYNEILNHSKNIIDLIEEGDYVNGYNILEKEGLVLPDGSCAFTVFKREGHNFMKIWKEEDIKSIVTKEMYKNIEYRLE